MVLGRGLVCVDSLPNSHPHLHCPSPIPKVDDRPWMIGHQVVVNLKEGKQCLGCTLGFGGTRLILMCPADGRIRLATLELSCLLLKQQVLTSSSCVIKDVHLACLEVRPYLPFCTILPG